MKTIITLFLILFVTPSFVVYDLFKQIHIKEANVPSNISKLSSYLDNEERQVKDIKWGVRKQIRFQKKNKKTEYSIIYIHGFSASKREIEPVVEEFADKIGANVFYTRLKGSGETDINSTKNVKLDSWLDAYDEAYKIGHIIGDKLIVMGVSTGAPIALFMSNKPQYSDVYKFVFVSPNIATYNKLSCIFLLPFGVNIANLIRGKIMKTSFENEIKFTGKVDYEIKSKEHFTSYVKPLVKLVFLVNFVDFKKFKTPMLVFYSQKDKVVDFKATEKFIKKYGGENEVVVVNNSQNSFNHLITGKNNSPNTVDMFVTKMSEFALNKKN